MVRSRGTDRVSTHPKSKRKPLKGIGSVLTSVVEAARMATLVITEGHSRYYRSHPERRYGTNRWTVVVRIRMVDEEIVRWAAKAMGGTHVTFDKSVGAWYTEATGSRAIAVLTKLRPFIIGEKTVMIDCILRRGKYVVAEKRPCTDCESKPLRRRRISALKERGLLTGRQPREVQTSPDSF